jgi:pimeloyl-ACP methyl ester carboxylesterase
MLSRLMEKILGVVTLSLTMVSTGVATERAASIEYEMVGRPANVQPDFTSQPDAALKFLGIKAIDGSRVEAVISQPNSKTVANTALVVTVHGSGGSYDSDPNGFLVRLLPGKGHAVLGINTRQSGARINTDNFLEVRRDIEAAVYTARALGYRKIILHGHSLGNIQVLYYAANNWEPDIKAVVLSGMFANLPWKSRHMLVQNEESFAQLHEASLKSLREGKQAVVLPIQMRRPGTQGEPVTGQHFLTYRAEQSSTADGTYWIRRVPQPILMLRDGGDSTIQPFEPSMLLSAATAPGSLVPSINYLIVPNPKGPNPRGHRFSDNQEPLVNAIAAWLQDQKL